MTMKLRKILFAAGLAATAAVPSARAADLPADAHLVFDVLYGDSQMRVGRADERWHVENGRYELSTELVPIIGPRIRYLSRGRITDAGLVPESFGEFRGSETSPRTRAEFDWNSQTLHYGKTDEAVRTAPLERGAQDVNALSFQIGWLGMQAARTMQVTTGKKVANYSFINLPATQATVNGRSQGAQRWRSGEGSARTEIWVAPQLSNLPIRVIRIDDDKQLQLVARDVTVGPAR